MSISIITTPNADGCKLAVSGEIDVSNASQLREELDQALDQGEGTIAVDLSEAPYIDSTGIGVLVGAARRAREAGRGFAVLRPQEGVARVLALLGMADELGLA